MGRAAPETPNLRSKNQRQRALSGGPPGAFATWQAAGGRAPQPPALSVGVVPGRQGCCCAVAARALTPIYPTVPLQAPVRACGAFFEWRAGQGVGAARSPAGARTRPLDATGATQACRQGVGGALPRHPCPRREAPGRPAGGACKACGAGGTPAGVPRARSPLGLAQRTKTLCRRQAFSALRASLFGFSPAPRRGPKSQRQKGNPGKPRGRGFSIDNVDPRVNCVAS